MLNHIDVRDPIVSEIEDLEVGFVLQILYSPDKVVVQIETLEYFTLAKPLYHLDLIEREYERV